MGNLIVIIVVAVVLTLAIRPLIKFHKSKGEEDFGCYKCSCSSECSKKSCK